MARTVGVLVAEARQLLNDEIPISGLPRYADAELMAALNEGLLQVRSKRPDAFLRYEKYPTYETSEQLKSMPPCRAKVLTGSS